MRIDPSKRNWSVIALAFLVFAGAATSASAGNTYGPNGAGNVNTNQQTMQQSSTQTTGLINDRISSASGTGAGTPATGN